MSVSSPLRTAAHPGTSSIHWVNATADPGLIFMAQGLWVTAAWDLERTCVRPAVKADLRTVKEEQVREAILFCFFEMC